MRSAIVALVTLLSVMPAPAAAAPDDPERVVMKLEEFLKLYEKTRVEEATAPLDFALSSARYEGDLGSLYRPKFIVGGVAIHGSPSIPNYPASHGCVRVANPVMDLIWGQNLLPLRSAVWIHD